ncbi:hypothetical protein F4809DRAFT_413322 [Biscogniauxia mediterranea]|nr:hypothetical protein F4809DRAFT_413322 [Biscogniauxia mediterranea]
MVFLVLGVLSGTLAKIPRLPTVFGGLLCFSLLSRLGDSRSQDVLDRRGGTGHSDYINMYQLPWFFLWAEKKNGCFIMTLLGTHFLVIRKSVYILTCTHPSYICIGVLDREGNGVFRGRSFRCSRRAITHKTAGIGRIREETEQRCYYYYYYLLTHGDEYFGGKKPSQPISSSLFSFNYTLPILVLTPFYFILYFCIFFPQPIYIFPLFGIMWREGQKRDTWKKGGRRMPTPLFGLGGSSFYLYLPTY